MWRGKRKYPYRIRIKPILNLDTMGKEPIKLYRAFGIINEKEEYTIEPYMKGILITKLTEDQLQKIVSIFRNLDNNIQFNPLLRSID